MPLSPTMISSRRVVLILQARMGSTRLPGKSLLPLAGRPLLARMLERVRRARRVNEIVVATTRKPEDDALAELVAAEGAAVYRGAENDLVERYRCAAEVYQAGLVVRLPADNAVPEPDEIDRIIEYHLRGESEFSSNLAEVLGNGYPDGIGAEVFERSALEEIAARPLNLMLREHPHLNFFDYRAQKPVEPERFRVGTIECPAAFRRPDLRLDVNTAEDYRFLAQLYDDLYPRNPNFHITEIIDWYDNVYQDPARAANVSERYAMKSPDA